LFMEHVDLNTACDLTDLQKQRDALVARGLLTSSQAALIDLESIAWLFCDDAGRHLRDARATVRREMGFMLAVEPARYDPSAAAHDGGDFMVVRGVIDCLYHTPEGIVILDWKTDAIAPASLPDRTALYGPQLEIYAAAAQDLLKMPVVQRRLVF